MSERALDATLKTSLLNEEPFLYAHLIKFERAVATEQSKPAKNARDYVYISDASFDIRFNDGSKNNQGSLNGIQVYRANRVGKVGSISETTEAKANSLTLEINSTLLGATSPAGASINIAYSGTAIGSTVTVLIDGSYPGWEESGFLVGDKICIKKSTHAFHNNRAVITSISSDGMTITCEALDASTTTNSVTSTFVINNAADEYESLFYEEYEGTDENGAYAGYINREVFIYKVHINPSTGEIIQTSDSTGPYLIFKGIIAKAKITEDPNRSSKMQWSLTSHWGDFVRVNGRLTADSEHRALASDGKVDTAALRRFEYGTDYGFMHAEKAINMISVYKASETRTRLKSSGWIFKKYKQEEYTVQVDREVDLRFNLDAKYLPLIYGVQRTDSIPIFADTLKKDSSEIYVVYAICEGEVGGIYDIYIDGESRICTDENDLESRGTAGDTVEVPCEGRMDRGDTLSSEAASSRTSEIWKYIDQYTYTGGNDMGVGAALATLKNFAPSPVGNANPLSDAGGVTHEMRTAIDSPINASFIFHAGRKHQRADDLMVYTADKTQNDGSGPDVTNQGFKLQDGVENENNYWGPQHRLLDTAYAVAKYKVADGDIEIPEVDFVVRGREIEQYNYDYSYEQHPNPVYASGRTATGQEASFNIGDTVNAFKPEVGGPVALTQNLIITDKFIYKNARNKTVTKFRFDKAPFSDSTTKTFYIVKSADQSNNSDKLTFATWDFLNNSGSLTGIIGHSVGIGLNDVVVTTSGSGVDIAIPTGNLKNVLTSVGTTGSVLLAFLPSGSTPSTTDIEKQLIYIQPSAYNTSTGKLEGIGNSSSTPTSGTLMIVNAAKIASNASAIDDYYKGQDIEITRSLADGSIKKQTQKIIKYHGSTRTAIFGDSTPDSVKIATVFVANGQNLTGGTVSGNTVTFNGTNAATAVAAVQTALAAGSVVSPANLNSLFEAHSIPLGTVVTATSGSTITYSQPINVNPGFPLYHSVQQLNAEMLQPGIGEFIPNTGDTYSIISRGDKKVSINPAIQLLDYLTDDRYGRGLDINDDINLSSFMKAARDCDTRSDVTLQILSGTTINVGSIYEYSVGTKVFWRGTVKSVQSVTGRNTVSYKMVTFKDCIGKLITKHEDWKIYEVGQLIWKRHPAAGSNPQRSITHKVTEAGRLGATLGATDLPLNGTAFNTGAGHESVSLSRPNITNSTIYAFSGGHTGDRELVSADGNPLIKGYDSATGLFNNSGYSLYDSDEVKYWRYMGWQSHSQSEVTRHQTNAVLRTETPVFDNVNSMLKHFNGVLRFSDGKYDLVVEQALDTDATWTATDVRKIDEGDIIGAISLDDAGLKGSANSVGVTIPDPSIRYDNRSVTFFNSEYLKQDRGVPKKKDIKTPLISNYFNARMNAEQYLIQSRSNKKINFKIGPKGVLLLAGELIKVTYPRFGFNEKVFRISNLSFTPDCLTQITAIEHDDKSYKIGAKRANNVNNSSSSTGGNTINVVRPTPPNSLTAAVEEGTQKVVLTWNNSVQAGLDWTTELLRNNTDVVTTADILQVFDIDKVSHEDREVQPGTTYYYWVRHSKTQKTKNNNVQRLRSLTFPSVNGREAVVPELQIKNRADVELYFNSASTTLASDDYPENITGFPDILYNFSTNPGITGTGSLAGSFVATKSYKIVSLGTTDFTAIGAVSVTAGSFVTGTQYVITTVGGTDFTAIGATSNTIGELFTATGPGTSTGTALRTLFTATDVGEGTGIASRESSAVTLEEVIGNGGADVDGNGTGWFIKPPPQGLGQNTFAIIGQAESTTLTDTITKIEWIPSTAYITIPTIGDAVKSSPTNLEHTFVMADDGGVTNDFSCSFNVSVGNNAYTYATNGTEQYTFGINVITNSISGGIAFTDINISATGVITIDGTSDILYTPNTREASFIVELIDRGNSDADFVQHTIKLKKQSLPTRDGVTYIFDVTSSSAATFKGTLDVPVAREAAALVIASPLTRFDSPTEAIRRIVPNDRVTLRYIEANTPANNIIAERVYKGFATNITTTVGTDSFSDVVTNRFEGSVIVDGTLSAETLLADSTITNQLNVGSTLKIGNTAQFNDDTLNLAKLHSHQKTAYGDNTPGFYLDGSGRVHIGDTTNFMKFDGTVFSFQGGARATKSVSIYKLSSSTASLAASNPSSVATVNYNSSVVTFTNGGAVSNGWHTTKQETTLLTPYLHEKAVQILAPSTGTDVTVVATAWYVVGINATRGDPGIPSYTWVKYGTSAAGAGLTNTYTVGTTKYIGMAFNKTTPTETEVAGDYIWSKIEGDPGLPSYTWVKYGTSAAGAGLTNTYTPGVTPYVGHAFNKTTATETDVAGDYIWSRLEGYTGQSVKTVFLFDHVAEGQAVLAVNSSGGSFANPTANNTSWVTTQPGLTADGDKVYKIQRTFTSDGNAPQDANWLGPVVVSWKQDGIDNNATTPSFFVITASNTSAPNTTAFTSVAGRGPIQHDVVVVQSSSDNRSLSYVYNGSGWVASQFIDGNLVVNGTIGAAAITAGSITAAKLQIGTAHDGTTSSLVLYDDKIQIYDGSNLRVVLGNLT